MTGKFTKNVLAVASLALFVSACGSNGGFQGQNSNTPAPPADNGGQGNPGGGTPGGTPNPSLQDQVNNLDLSAFIAEGSAANTQAADLDKTRGEFIVRIPLQFVGIFPLLKGTHPKLPGVTFETVFDAQKGFSLVVRIPLAYILRNVATAAPGRLPNGDALPGIPSGELPMVNVVFNSKRTEKIYLYLSKEYFAVLFESQFNLGIDLTSEIRSKNNLNTVGYFSLIAEKNKHPAAFMVSLRLSPQVAALLDDYFLN